jgi:hypothetical protein
MYAAEGSDRFWWYGTDQEAPGGDEPFDIAFLAYLRNVYSNAQHAGGRVAVPSLLTILLPQQQAAPPGEGEGQEERGVMAGGKTKTRTVLVVCDARAQSVARDIYIAGNLPQLGGDPNRIAMHDDGTGGDEKAGDGIWMIRLELPVGAGIQAMNSLEKTEVSDRMPVPDGSPSMTSSGRDTDT